MTTQKGKIDGKSKRTESQTFGSNFPVSAAGFNVFNEFNVRFNGFNARFNGFNEFNVGFNGFNAGFNGFNAGFN